MAEPSHPCPTTLLAPLSMRALTDWHLDLVDVCMAALVLNQAGKDPEAEAVGIALWCRGGAGKHHAVWRPYQGVLTDTVGEC